MEHVWSVLCDSSVIDQDSRKVSLLNIIERIEFFVPDDVPDEKIEGIPVNPTLFTMLWRTTADEEETGYLRVLIQLPNGDMQEDIPALKVSLKEEHQRFRAKFNFTGLPYAGVGVYKLIVQLRPEFDEVWSGVAAIPFEIYRKPLP